MWRSQTSCVTELQPLICSSVTVRRFPRKHPTRGKWMLCSLMWSTEFFFVIDCVVCCYETSVRREGPVAQKGEKGREGVGRSVFSRRVEGLDTSRSVVNLAISMHCKLYSQWIVEAGDVSVLSQFMFCEKYSNPSDPFAKQYCQKLRQFELRMPPTRTRVLEVSHFFNLRPRKHTYRNWLC